MNHHNHEAKNLDNSLTDPVCGMAVTKASKFHEENNHTTYYFCSEKCQFKFNANPSFYITKGKETTTQESSPESPSSLIASGQQTNLTETAIYTCPMHPEIRQDHPGNCPICGMSLEPLLPDLDEVDENPELVHVTIHLYQVDAKGVKLKFDELAPEIGLYVILSEEDSH